MARVRIGPWWFALAERGDGTPLYEPSDLPFFPPQVAQGDVTEAQFSPEGRATYSFRDLSGGYGQVETPLREENRRYSRIGDAAGEGVDCSLTPEGPIILAPALVTPTLTPAATGQCVGPFSKAPGSDVRIAVGRYTYVWSSADAITADAKDLGAGNAPTDSVLSFVDVTGTTYYYAPLGQGKTMRYTTDPASTNWADIGTGGGITAVQSLVVLDGAACYIGLGLSSGAMNRYAEFDDGGTTPTEYGVIEPLGSPHLPVNRLLVFNDRIVALKANEGLLVLAGDRRTLDQDALPELRVFGAGLQAQGAKIWRNLLWLPGQRGLYCISPAFTLQMVGPDITGMSGRLGSSGIVQAVGGDTYNLYAFLYTGTTTASWLLKANVTTGGGAVQDIAWHPLLQLAAGVQCRRMDVVEILNGGPRLVLDWETAAGAYGISYVKLPSQGRDPRADSAYVYASGGTLYHSRATARFPAISKTFLGLTPLCRDLGYKLDEQTATTALTVTPRYKLDTTPLTSSTPFGYTAGTAQTAGVGSQEALDLRGRGLDVALRLATTDTSITPQVQSLSVDYVLQPTPVWQHSMVLDISAGAHAGAGSGGIADPLSPSQALAWLKTLPGSASFGFVDPIDSNLTHQVICPPGGVKPVVAGPPQADGQLPLRVTLRLINTVPST